VIAAFTPKLNAARLSQYVLDVLLAGRIAIIAHHLERASQNQIGAEEASLTYQEICRYQRT
jgi:hypothetical protein